MTQTIPLYNLSSCSKLDISEYNEIYTDENY